MHRNKNIDALRALSIIWVVGFHYFPTVSFFRAGYLGVDIFFVISGYVITKSLLELSKSNPHTLKDFYTARIIRLFPSLILIVTTLIFITWYFFPVDQFNQLVAPVLASITYTSNFLYSHQANYFDSSANTKPLLHLWSLGIEEQFYIVWPGLFIFLIKKKRFIKRILFILAGSSFAYFLIEGKVSATTIFYSPFARFWELAIGCYLALNLENESRGAVSKSTQKRLIFGSSTQIFALISILFILGNSLPISRSKYFSLVIIVALTAMFIRNSVSTGILGIGNAPPLLYFGRISYALYLWHWVILVIAIAAYGEDILKRFAIHLIFLSISAAHLSTFYVEKYFKNQLSKQKTAKNLLAYSALLGLLVILLSTVPVLHARNQLYKSNSIIGNLGFEEIKKYQKSHNVACSLGEHGFPVLESHELGAVTCLESQKNRPIGLLIVGDSHAGDLFVGFSEALPKINVATILFYGSQGFLAEDNPAFKATFEYMTKGNTKNIIISNMWGNPGVGLLDGDNSIKLSKLVQALSFSKKNIFISDDRPYFPFDPAECKHISIGSSKRKCSGLTENYNELYTRYFPIIQRITSEFKNTQIINMRKIFCETNVCSMMKNNQLLFADRSHFNILGSRYVALRLIESQSILKKLKEGVNPSKDFLTRH